MKPKYGFRPFGFSVCFYSAKDKQGGVFDKGEIEELKKKIQEKSRIKLPSTGN